MWLSEMLQLRQKVSTGQLFIPSRDKEVPAQLRAVCSELSSPVIGKERRAE